MELANLFPITQTLTIAFPDGTPTGITFNVVGTDSKAFHTKARHYAQLAVDSTGSPTIEGRAQQEADMLAACVVGWTGLDEGGKALPYSHEKAVELLSTPELSFIKEQVEGYVTKRASFFRQGENAA